MADIGQEEDFEAAKQKALSGMFHIPIEPTLYWLYCLVGASAVYVEDVREEFVKELCFPAIQCNATYENVYLLGMHVSFADYVYVAIVR